MWDQDSYTLNLTGGGTEAQGREECSQVILGEVDICQVPGWCLAHSRPTERLKGMSSGWNQATAL